MAHLAIAKITSWVGISIGAEHMYVKLILPNIEEITEKTYGEWAISDCDGESHEVTRKMSYREACKLSKKDDNPCIKWDWENGDKNTERFDTFKQVKKAVEQKYKELNLSCPLVYMYEGDAMSNEELEKLIANGQ